MKMRFMLQAARRAGVAAAAVEKFCHRGVCTAVRVKCNQCEQWVKADDWNPRSAVCDDCTSHRASRQIVVSKPIRWIPTGNGKPRRNTGVK